MASQRPVNARVYAVEAVRRVLAGRSLDAALDEISAGLPAGYADAPLIQEMVYGTLRWTEQLRGVLAPYLKKPLKNKDQDLFALLLIGLYQLKYMRLPAHAAVMETVAAAEDINKPWAKGLVNSVLRTFLREQRQVEEKIAAAAALRFSHPSWLIEEIQQAWPACWERILAANNTRPPMSLRVNLLKRDRQTYLAELGRAGIPAAASAETDCGLVLECPLPVTQLPGFTEGAVSVQDIAAQLAAILLNPGPGQYILDACAAPGGKAAHLLERAPAADVVALDIDRHRLERVRQNLQRLGLEARVVAGDAASPQEWWDGRLFERILVDAPCSATGVIRRHPDIKIHRRPTDIAKLHYTQKQILASLWPLLAPGGNLLYVTCSILRQENEDQIAPFLAAHSDAVEIDLPVPHGVRRTAGRQILPGEHDMDGFYYVCLQKH